MRSGRRALVGALAALALPALPAASAQALTISPLNGTPDASPETQVSFLGISPREIGAVSVVGSRSGSHAGHLRAYASEPGASFVPERPFEPGESVRVSAEVGPATHRERATSSFTVARPADYEMFAPRAHDSDVTRRREREAARASATPPAGAVQSFLSTPELRPPSVFVTMSSAQASPGDLFLAPDRGFGQYGPMIVSGSGQLVWFQEAPAGEVAMDLQEERYEGRPALVWWQGRIASIGVGIGSDVVYDTSYRQVARIAAGNGYQADLHEAQLTARGAAFITAYAAVDADLSPEGGASHGMLLDSILQEVDVKTGLVMFEWHAFGHVALSDSYTAPHPVAKPWDFFHINSVSLDPWGDGNFIVSSRNTSAAYEISGHTGEVMWRIGGRRPSFRMGAGTGMAYQHDVRWQADHTLTIFDDGAYPKVHDQSRAIRERIDWGDHTVRLVGRDVHTPPLLAGSQGNDEVLPDGNSFVGWGEERYLSEFNPSGQLVFDARLAPYGQSYRAYRFPWSATPASPPALAVRASGGGQASAYASWNGATGVSSWRILAGASATSLAPLVTAPRSGFETKIALSTSDQWFAAQALGASGRVLGTSATLKI